MSLSRQNYPDKSEALVNQQINMMLKVHHQYLAMYAFYKRDEVALKGFAKLFKKLADRAYDLSKALIDYQNMRGGKVVFNNIDRPVEQDWKTPLNAIEFSLNLEKNLNQTYLDLYKAADNCGDTHLDEYVKEHLLNEQVRIISKVANHRTSLQTAGEGLGVFEFDQHLLSLNFQMLLL